MNQEAPKFTRRWILRSAAAIPAVAVLSSCDVLFPQTPQSRIDEAIVAFTSSNIDPESWERYTKCGSNPRIVCGNLPLKFGIPPDWEPTGLSVGEGGLDPTLQREAIALRKKGRNLPLLIVTSRLTSKETEQSAFQSAFQFRLDWSRRFQDLRITDVTVFNKNSKMISCFYKAADQYLQYHNIILVSNGRLWDISFTGNPGDIVREMPTFKGVLRTFQPLN